MSSPTYLRIEVAYRRQSGRRGEDIDFDAKIFAISAAAELAGMHPQTLRQYDRIGLVEPGRTPGGGRRYSARDVTRLREIQRLSQDEGVNLAGVKRIMDLEREVAAMRSDMSAVVEELHRARAQLAELRAMAGPFQRTSTDIVLWQGKRQLHSRRLPTKRAWGGPPLQQCPRGATGRVEFGVFRRVRANRALGGTPVSTMRAGSDSFVPSSPDSRMRVGSDSFDFKTPRFQGCAPGPTVSRCVRANGNVTLSLCEKRLGSSHVTRRTKTKVSKYGAAQPHHRTPPRGSRREA
ncbi:MerR family transcriptional regulator [Glycomyces buryatensis]|uniref:MerR family transcriptional regulator n=1 Tax=Glycomyces buryatensis TaxID=2570927 RepID=A0A4S8QBP4_9ACTN|nr:MerR family transcriptional regulator [Glycomyces buryatensis]